MVYLDVFRENMSIELHRIRANFGQSKETLYSRTSMAYYSQMRQKGFIVQAAN
jgi:hypothetical protein